MTVIAHAIDGASFMIGRYGSFIALQKAANSYAVNTRLLKQLCKEKNKAFARLLLYTEVRWLSRGNCLTRFYSFLDTKVEFLQSCDPGLSKEFIVVRNDVANFLDIFARFNKLNLSLLSNQVNLIKVKSALPGFNNKLVVYQRNLLKDENFFNSQVRNNLIPVTEAYPMLITTRTANIFKS